MTDFTPGPWEVSGRDDRLWIAAPHPELGSKPVAMISPMPDEYVANARLIAHAPELVEALEAAHGVMQRLYDAAATDDHELHATMLEARSVLAAIRGDA